MAVAAVTGLGTVTRLPSRLKPLWPYAKQSYTAMTRVVAPPLMRLDARRGGWLPHAVATSTDAALAAGAGVRHVLGEGENITREPPEGRPPGSPTFARQRSATTPSPAVLELPGGRVLGPGRAVITRDGALLHDEVRYFGTTRGSEHPVFLQRGVRAPTEVAGDLVVLASRGDGNYYHFLHDVLPRLDLVERWSADVASTAQYYVPTATRFQRELLELVGVPQASIVDAGRHPHVRADRLVMPTLPDLDLNHPHWAARFLRERLLPRTAGPVAGRRIYVTRGRVPRTRIVVNEDDVLARLLPLGFEVVDPSALSVREQITAFAEAETIVAPHGAALANLVFAGAGATVLELFPPDFVQGCYWKLSTCVAGLRYRYLVGTGRASRWREGRGVASDIGVDPDTVVQTVRSLLPLSAGGDVA